MKKIYIPLLTLLTSSIFISCGQTEVGIDSTNANSYKMMKAPPEVGASSYPQVPLVGASSYPQSSNTPVTFNTEKYNHIESNVFKSTKTSPLSTISIDVDTASYTNIIRMIEDEDRFPPSGAVRIEEMINYFTYNYEEPTKNAIDPFSLTTELSTAPWEKEHKLLLVGLKAKDVPKADLPSSNLVALIDLSGSMKSDLPLVKKSLKILLQKLDTHDRLSIVGYANGVGLMLAPTPADEKEKIISAIESLRSYGGTDGEGGIEFAYKQAKESFMPKGNNRVIIFTDGDFNVGRTSQSEIVDIIKEKRKSGVYLSVVGFGYGNVNDALMEQMADRGNGNYSYINDLLDAKKIFSKEFDGTLYTLAKDVKFQIEFNPAVVESYRLIGYENRKLNNEDFNDDTKDAGEIGVGDSVTVLYELVMQNELNTTVKPKVDALKYQKNIPTQEALATKELATLKMRYKKEGSETSTLMTKVIAKEEKATQNITFASSVAWFGRTLRDSSTKKSDYKSIIKLAKKSKGRDEEGYRAHFIRVVEKAELLEVP